MALKVRSSGNTKEDVTDQVSPRMREAQVKVDTSVARAKIGVGEQAIEVGEKFEVSRLRREKKLFDAQIRIAEREDTLNQLDLLGDYKVGAKNLVAQLDQSTPPGKPIDLNLLKVKLDELDKKAIDSHTTGTEESILEFQQKIQEQRNIIEVGIASGNITAQEVRAFDQLQRTINNSKALTLSHGAGPGIIHFNQAFDRDLAPLFPRKTEPEHQLNGQRQLVLVDLDNKYKNDEVFGIEEMLADPFFSDILGPPQLKMQYEKLDRFNNKRANSEAQKTSNKFSEMARALGFFDEDGNPDPSQLSKNQKLLAIGQDPTKVLPEEEGTTKETLLNGLKLLGLVKPVQQPGQELKEGETPAGSGTMELTQPELDPSPERKEGDLAQPEDPEEAGQLDMAALMKDEPRITIPLVLLLMGLDPSKLPEGPLADFNKKLATFNEVERVFGRQDNLVKKTMLGIPWTSEEKGTEAGIQDMVKEDVVITNRLLNLHNAGIHLTVNESARLWGAEPDELKAVIAENGGKIWVKASIAEGKYTQLGAVDQAKLDKKGLLEFVYGQLPPEDRPDGFSVDELKMHKGVKKPRMFETARERMLVGRQKVRMDRFDAGATSARASLQSLKVMKGTVAGGKLKGGPLASARLVFAQMGALIGTKDLSAYKIPDAASAEVFESAGAQLKLDLITAMEGIRATNAALKVVTDKVGALSKSDIGNEIIIDIGIAIANRQIDQQRIASKMLYEPGGLDGNQEEGGDKRTVEDRIDQLEKDDPVIDAKLFLKIEAGGGEGQTFSRMMRKQQDRVRRMTIEPEFLKQPKGYVPPQGHEFFAITKTGKNKGIPIIIETETGKKFTDKKWKDRIKPEEYVPPESKKKVKKTP